jgi:hypothetical protein
MGDDDIGQLCQAEPILSAQQIAALSGQRQLRRGQPVIIKNQFTAAIGQEREQFQQRMKLRELNDDEIGIGEYLPGLLIADFPANNIGPKRRMGLAVVNDNNVDGETALDQGGNLFDQLAADRVAGARIQRNQHDPHGGPSVEQSGSKQTHPWEEIVPPSVNCGNNETQPLIFTTVASK